jgi:hypothetical protein
MLTSARAMAAVTFCSREDFILAESVTDSPQSSNLWMFLEFIAVALCLTFV